MRRVIRHAHAVDRRTPHRAQSAPVGRIDVLRHMAILELHAAGTAREVVVHETDALVAVILRRAVRVVGILNSLVSVHLMELEAAAVQHVAARTVANDY